MDCDDLVAPQLAVDGNLSDDILEKFRLVIGKLDATSVSCYVT
jgi:hypothetical protein